MNAVAAAAHATGTAASASARVDSVEKRVENADLVQVDKDNLVATVVEDGGQKLEDVYKDVPGDQWPK